MEHTVRSRNGIPIRLSEERWAHIIDEHGEMAGLQTKVIETVQDPSRVYAGNAGELLAIRELPASKWLVVVYRELA